MRAIQVIQPTSNPTKSPNAARVYTMAPPAWSKRLAASAKQRTSRSTANPAARIAQMLAGPRSCAAATGRIRQTPLHGTAVDEQEHGEPRRENRADARGAQKLRRGDRQDQVDAAADHVVDRERDELPPR